ncbi:MAG: amino acid ABC transporter permease [Pseudomonadota bacterium]
MGWNQETLVAALSRVPGFAEAALVALVLAIAAIVVSWVVGLMIVLAGRYKVWAVRAFAAFYVWFIRGTPTLILIFMVYFGLPQLGLGLDPYTAGILALGLSGAAYVAEILRAGFSAIPEGQFEAGRSLGLSTPYILAFIIIPQLLRIVVPALTNEAVNTLKNTSLLSAITIVEITLYARQQIASTFRPFDYYILAAIFYLLMAEALNQFARWYERRYPPLTN